VILYEILHVKGLAEDKEKAVSELKTI